MFKFIWRLNPLNQLQKAITQLQDKLDDQTKFNKYTNKSLEHSLEVRSKIHERMEKLESMFNKIILKQELILRKLESKLND